MFPLQALRPRHWIKNILVFFAPILSLQLKEETWIPAIFTFFIFSITASAIYLFNDCKDITSDRKHPLKKERPIAKGILSIKKALLVSYILLFFSTILTLFILPKLLPTIIIYIFVQLLYSSYLKNQPLFDILCIAIGFLLRAIAGGLAASITLSPWFLLTIWFLALFLAIVKRKTELGEIIENSNYSRDVLKRYSLSLLIRYENLVSTSALICYALWASGPQLGGAPTKWMLLTVIFVIVGIFRYQYLTDRELRSVKNDHLSGQNPEIIFLEDKFIFYTIFSWLISVIFILKINQL